MKTAPESLIGYLAVDQYGQTEKLTSPKHPRKQLLAKLGVKSVQLMFRDTVGGLARHVGYIAQGRWFTIHEVHDWKGN